MSRRRLLVAALAMVGLSAVSVAVSGRGSGGGQDAVGKVVAFLGGTGSASFEGSLQVVLPQGTTQDNGIKGNIELPDRSREFLLDEGQIITVQVIALGGRVYEARSGLPSTYEVGPAAAGHSLNLWRPAELRELIRRLEAVTVTGRTIRGRAPVSALVTAPLGGQADVELTVDSRGRPERLHWQMEVASAGTVRVNGDVAYKEWTARTADIAVPEEVDNTPEVDEDEVAAFQRGPVLAPTKLPVGYELSNVFVQDGDGVSCPRAELDYFQPDRHFARFILRVPAIKAPRLSIEMSPRSCRPEPLPDGAPFVAGAIQGTVAQAPTLPGDEPFRFFTADAGTFRIRVETNLTQDEVLAAIGSLAPIDLATQPVHQGRDIGDDDPLAILDVLVRHTLQAA
jgi:hypothetical protein